MRSFSFDRLGEILAVKRSLREGKTLYCYYPCILSSTRQAGYCRGGNMPRAQDSKHECRNIYIIT